MRWKALGSTRRTARACSKSPPPSRSTTTSSAWPMVRGGSERGEVDHSGVLRVGRRNDRQRDSVARDLRCEVARASIRYPPKVSIMYIMYIIDTDRSVDRSATLSIRVLNGADPDCGATSAPAAVRSAQLGGIRRQDLRRDEEWTPGRPDHTSPRLRIRGCQGEAPTLTKDRGATTRMNRPRARRIRSGQRTAPLVSAAMCTPRHTLTVRGATLCLDINRGRGSNLMLGCLFGGRRSWRR
jgi:hypothetical protein